MQETQPGSQFAAKIRRVATQFATIRPLFIATAVGALLCAALLAFLVRSTPAPPGPLPTAPTFSSIPIDVPAAELSVEQQLHIQQAAGHVLTRQVLSLLQAPFGPGRVEAMVRVEINFEKYEEIAKAFVTPAGVGGVVRSEHQVDERLSPGESQVKGSVPLKGLIAGSVSPGAGDAVMRNERSVQYEVNQTEVRREIPPGAIKRLSVAVLIDGQLSAEEESAIERTITSALGLDPARGDQVHVESMPFAFRQGAGSQTSGETASWWRVAPVAVGIGVTGLLFLVALLIRRLRPRAVSGGAGALSAEEEAPAPERNVSPEERKQQEMRVKVLSVAKEKPDNIARLLKSWLAEE